jgi:hypothetical protein
MRICYLGSGENLDYLASVFLSEWEAQVIAANLPWYSTRQALLSAQSQVELTILDLDFPLHWFASWLIGSKPMLTVPRWLKQSIDIPVDSWEEMLPLIRRKTRNEAKRMIAKFHLEFDLVQSDAAARNFYRQLYRPMVRARFGDQGVIVDEAQFLAECAKGRIAVVRSEGRMLAAVLVQVANRKLLLKWFGASTQPEDAESVRGASDALDFYTLKLAVEGGFRSVDMGHCRPCLNDGVLRYKRKWGASINTGRVPKGRFVLVPGPVSRVLCSALESNPLVTVERGGPTARLWAPSSCSSAAELAATVSRFAVPGLRRMKVFVEHEVPPDDYANTLSVPTTVVSLAGVDNPVRHFVTG